MSGKKADDGTSSEGTVIQRVIREVGSGSSYPVLTKTNYSDWALLMKVKLKARALWHVIEKKGADPQEEMMALDALCGAVPPEMMPSVAQKETAKEAWEAIATMRIGNDRVRKSTAEQLRRKIDLATFGDGESVEDYALRLGGMAAHLVTLGEEMKESEIVAKILRSLPHRFKQITIAIRTLLDVSTMTVAELTGRLKEAEEAYEDPPPSLQHDGKLYLTEEEWNSRRKKLAAENHAGDGASGSSARRGGGAGKRGRGRGRGGPSGGPPNSNKPTGDECRRCGKLGHWTRECRSQPKREQANVAVDEEEALLNLVVSSTVEISQPSPKSIDASVARPPAPVPPEETAHPHADMVPRAEEVARTKPEQGGGGSTAAGEGANPKIHLREEKVFAQLGEKGDRDTKAWVLDTGATNHMSGSRAAFHDLDTTVLGTVRFGDDSVAQIEGRGTVTFVCNNGKHRSFHNVYHTRA